MVFKNACGKLLEMYYKLMNVHIIIEKCYIKAPNPPPIPTH